MFTSFLTNYSFFQRLLSLSSEAEIVKQQAKSEALQKQVNAQEISPDEFERMSTERDTLERQRLEVEALIAEEKNKGWNLELSLNQRQDALEKDVKAFNLLGAEVGLFPMTINPDGMETELLELEIVHSNIETMLPKGVDMKKLIKPTILELKRKAVEEYQEISDRKEKDQAEFDELADQSAILTSENANMEKRKDDITAVANHNHQVSTEDNEDDSMGSFIGLQVVDSDILHSRSLFLCSGSRNRKRQRYTGAV